MSQPATRQPEEQLTLGNALPCPKCHATGEIRLMGLPGRRTCPQCGGTGWVFAEEMPADADPGVSA